jgi:imidazolonepropionase-like amidohydrolase
MGARPPVAALVALRGMWRLWLVTVAVACSGNPPAPAKVRPPSGTAFVNGAWFDGERFVARTMYVVDGRFVSSPIDAAVTVDLKGGFVVPPFAEAHNHNVDENDPPALVYRYLSAGVFYAKNPDNLPKTRRALAGILNRPQSLDATFANGGFTSPGGHPIGVVRRNIERGGMTEADGDGAFYYAVDSEAAIARVWPAFLATSPDFVKAYLLYSEEFAARAKDPRFEAWRGLDPALLPGLVKRAHAARLRVVVHVESATDLHHAVAAGADEIAHTPGFRPDETGALKATKVYLISDADAAAAARQGTVVITTLGGMARAEGAMREQARAIAIANLTTLKRNGVTIGFGSDSYRGSVVDEVQYLRTLGVFTDAELLRLWARTAATSIFPGRKLGRLEPGYEASFVVLASDPLVDFEAIKLITTAYKQGERLVLAPPPK